MNMKWKYKIDLADESVFAEIEQARGIAFPEELRGLIAEANGATPEKYHFTIGKTDHVFGAVLSFNKDEADTDSIFTALESVEDKNLLPFAIDPFGNYICYSLKEHIIVFWDHEKEMNDGVSSTGKSLSEFLKALY